MQAWWFIALLAAAVAAGPVAAGCGDGDDRRPKKSAGVGFEVVVDETTCGVEKPFRKVIRDKDAWAELWSAIHRTVEPVPERPDFDFSRQMLIVVAMGTRRSGGYNISVERVDETEAGLEVTVRESQPPAGAMVGMSLTQPVEVVVVDRSGEEVVFVDADTTPTPEREQR